MRWLGSASRERKFDAQHPLLAAQSPVSLAARASSTLYSLQGSSPHTDIHITETKIAEKSNFTRKEQSFS